MIKLTSPEKAGRSIERGWKKIDTRNKQVQIHENKSRRNQKKRYFDINL